MPQQISQSNIQSAGPRVQSAIADASRKTGVDFGYLVSQARVESNFNPSAKAPTSSASGLYQFTRQTWLATVKEYGAEHGLDWAANGISARPDGRYVVTDPSLKSSIYALRNQPEAAASMAAEFAGKNKAHLENALGRSPETVDLYLAHFLGAGGASRFLKGVDSNPDQAAAPLFPKAAAANRNIFYTKSGGARSLTQIRDLFDRKLNNGAPAIMPAATQQASFPGAGRFTAGGLNQNSNGFSVTPASQVSNSAGEERRPLQMMTIEPMPARLSLDFAHKTYQRLESMRGGGQ